MEHLDLPHIISADDTSQPSKDDLYDIRTHHCIHCRKPYSPSRKIGYVRLIKNNQLIWWHQFGWCKIKEASTTQRCGTCNKPLEKIRTTTHRNYPHICFACFKEKQRIRSRENLKKKHDTPL